MIMKFREYLKEAKAAVVDIDVSDVDSAVRDLKKIGIVVKKGDIDASNSSLKFTVPAPKKAKVISWLKKNGYEDLEELYPALFA